MQTWVVKHRRNEEMIVPEVRVTSGARGGDTVGEEGLLIVTWLFILFFTISMIL